jgi:anionic cell wall polymer biosynthesis LytR-Cps2A-Psr (LCP) family protein
LNSFIFFIKILRLRQQHKLELQTIINEMSTNTTETRVSDLLRKLESQNATIIHLKVTGKTNHLFQKFSIYLMQKLTEHADEKARELAVLRIQDDELKSTINRLEQELSDARNYHTPVNDLIRYFYLFEFLCF